MAPLFTALRVTACEAGKYTLYYCVKEWHDQVTDIQSDALFILLVEKDAAFMRLAEDRFYNTYPCIILTAKGQPDVASRCTSCICICCACILTGMFHKWEVCVAQALSEEAQGHTAHSCPSVGRL